MLWSRGYARASLMGAERTHNPSPAAASMIGRAAVARTQRRLLAVRQSRKSHKDNFVPAVLGAFSLIQKLGVLGKLGNFLKNPKDAVRVANAQAAFNKVMAGDGADANKAMDEIMQLKDNSATQVGKDAYKTAFDQLLAAGRITQGGMIQPMTATPLAGAPGVALPPGYARDIYGNIVAQALPSPTGTTRAPTQAELLAAAAVKGLSGSIGKRRARYPAYRDRYGRPHYSNKPPGSAFRLPAGGTPLLEAGMTQPVYSFFTGAIGKGGAGTTAAQLGVAAAAGAGAYLVTQKLLQYLGGRAQSAEEAGVNAARAHREALLAHPDQRAAINAAYFAKLQELGYDPQTFTRTRGAVSQFLEDYNPFGG